MKILYKLTTRSRPAKMFACIQNIRAMTIEKDPWIIISMDKNDHLSFNPQVWQPLSRIPNVTHIYGQSKNKIDAFNRDVPSEGWDIIVATSDDIKFLHGFDDIIQKDVEQFAVEQLLNFQPTYDCTVWYGDGHKHGKIMTVPIMTKKYYDRLGYIYNPVYGNLWADEEAIYVGENLKKIYYSDKEIMVHMHPHYGLTNWDQQYKYTDSFYHKEKVIFDKRKAEGFPI